MADRNEGKRRLSLAAIEGLVSGLASGLALVACSARGVSVTAPMEPATPGATVPARVLPLASPPPPLEARDCCQGKNDCKGKSGCGGANNECKGQNDCKGTGTSCDDAPPAARRSRPRP